MLEILVSADWQTSLLPGPDTFHLINEAEFHLPLPTPQQLDYARSTCKNRTIDNQRWRGRAPYGARPRTGQRKTTRHLATELAWRSPFTQRASGLPAPASPLRLA
ncbi:MAG TPA: hypothetical protein VG099_03670, partial [Gemmataceae bacterium]|nr:hypothetical protein [Gemmataceae bacterium]